MRVRRPHGHGLEVHLLHRIAIAIDRHVEAVAEHMLVHMRLDARRHQRAMGRGAANGNGGGEGNARGLHLDPDRAVLVEVPEEAVDVVSDGRDRGNHQPAGALHRHLTGRRVGILPQRAEILLMHADGVADQLRLAVPVMAPGIEIVDVTEAIAAEREGIEQLPDAVFAGVEGVAARVAAGRVAIGHDHLRHRRAVHDGAEPALVFITDLMEDQTIADVEAHPDLPFLPAHQMALDREAWAFGLHDLERLQVGAGLLLDDRRAFGRQRNDAEVIEAQQLHVAQVDDRVEIGDRPRIGIVARGVAHPAMAVGEALALLLGNPEMPRRPGLDQHAVEIRDAALRQGFDEAGIGLGRKATGREFIGDDPRLALCPGPASKPTA